MMEPCSALKARKVKKDLYSSRSSIYSGNSLTEFNSGKSQKLGSSSLEKLSFTSEKDTSSFESYDIQYSNYLLRKLQNHLLKVNKKQKEENLKKCLISLKFEFSELLDKHLNLKKCLAFTEMYMGAIKECNTKIELGSILKIFEKNNLILLFNSVSDILYKTVNNLQLVGISKAEVEKVFSEEMIGEKSKLNEYLNNVYGLSVKNKPKVENIANEIEKIETLLQENLFLKEKYQNLLDSKIKNISSTNYEVLTKLIEKSLESRFQNNKKDITTSDELFTIEELMQTFESK